LQIGYWYVYLDLCIEWFLVLVTVRAERGT
jgi:hypothetical protein